MPSPRKKGNFNCILYGPRGRAGIQRCLSLRYAIKVAEDWAAEHSMNYASVRRITDAKPIGLAAMRFGGFRFES